MPLFERESDEARQLRKLARKLIDTHGISRSEIVPGRGEFGFTGFTFSNELLVGAPYPPRTPGELFVLAHEVGHVRLHVRRDRNGWYRLADLPSHVLEFEAEKFAIDWFAAEGLPVPETVRQAAARNVAAAIQRDVDGGMAAGDAQAAAVAFAAEAPVDDGSEGLGGADMVRCTPGQTLSRVRSAGQRVGMVELLAGLVVALLAVAIWLRT